MGTLPSSNFINLSFGFRLLQGGGRFRGERRWVVKEKKWRKLCVQCEKRSLEMWRVRRRRWFDKVRCFSLSDGEGEEDRRSGPSSSSGEEVEHRGGGSDDDVRSERTRASVSPRPPISLEGPVYNSFQVDSFKLMELLGPEKVDPSDVKLIKENLFGYSTFWVTKEEPFGDLNEGILFLGNLRGNREHVFAKLQHKLHEVVGGKYNLFMVEEPNSEGPDPRGGPRVSFGLLRKEVSEPGPTSLWQYVIALLLFVLTIGSCVELGIASQISSLPPVVVKYFTDPDAIEPPDMQLLFPYVETALPLAYTVLAVQLIHEIGHFAVAFSKKVKLGIPFFIPNITLGSFGAITQFKSILPDRRTKVDISMAGPLAGAALSFSMFCVGLLLSSNPAAAGDLVEVPSMLFQGSLLLGLISRATLGHTAMHAATVSIHPLVIGGWCGLTTTAFNMLPVGCLDGGRAVQGAFGKNVLFAFGLATYLMLGLGVLGGPLSLPWGLYVLICQRTPEKPCLNDVTGVGKLRQTALIATISLVVFTLLPVWDELAEELGIGLTTAF
ncbi:probable zinc metalloprotease EGY1, chloroplastic isoform X1 [Dendrobium catenatum]|uniref:probable zinc metalloprotease EGY1, chloroplastic isoform X1 n=1 Tax=Dendrobium catenatum TaxID=906689 RepID=UPI0009F27284|nr:probable zinc metalloprotease EGY1, chloroplastic isoform X1 [Dendrobium catenatum]